MGRSRAGVGVVVAAVVGAALAWAAWRLGGVELRVGSGASARAVTLPAVVVTAAVAATAGVLTRRLLVRRLRHGRRGWLVLAAVVLAVSLVGPLGAASLSAGLALASLHLVVAAVVTAGATRLDACVPQAA